MKKIDPDGWGSFWIPAGIAAVFMIIICLVVWVTTTRVTRQVESNINKRIENLTEPVYVSKYDSLTQSLIDTIEVNRKISHDHIDHYYDAELQNALDSTFSGDASVR